jgi:hypothetical protein
MGGLDMPSLAITSGLHQVAGQYAIKKIPLRPQAPLAKLPIPIKLRALGWRPIGLGG